MARAMFGIAVWIEIAIPSPIWFLNIIANAIINGDSVAVVSNNNSATKNVIDKLRKYDVDFIAAYLGKSSNKEEFINSQEASPNKDIKHWIIEED